MAKIFELYWPRETGSNAGTRLTEYQLESAGLDAAARARVLALAGNSDGVFELRLPFVDRRECRRKGEVLRATRLIREGNAIRSVPASQSASLRDLAAYTLLTRTAWRAAPHERDRKCFRTWQTVSLAVQRALRIWIPEIYFRDSAQFEDRVAAYPVLLYRASRPCHGRPRTEFTYDVADPQSMTSAWRMTGQSLQSVLAHVETRLHVEGQPVLARRYAPIWSEDIIRAVKQRPRPFVEMLAQEAMLVNAVIGLGTSRSMMAVKPFARAANAALRRMAGMDMRSLSYKVMEEATDALARANAGTADQPMQVAC